MRLLAIVHEKGPVVGVFGEVAAELGHAIDEWSPAGDAPPPLPFERYDAVWVFGGVQNTHEEDDFPWLVDENRLIQRFLAEGTPLLGVCLGGQLIAKAAGSAVHRIEMPEIGFTDVELTDAAASDPLFCALPGQLKALQWHYYRFELPEGAVLLARNDACPQAYRLGERAWGFQFHPETTRSDFLRWIAEYDAVPVKDETGFEPARLRHETDLWIEQWNDVGRTIAGRFLAFVAGQASTPTG